jgi:hypothetical protein
LRRHLERERERDNTPSRSRVLRISKVRSWRRTAHWYHCSIVP